MFIRKKKFNKLMQRLDDMQMKADALIDPLTSRGSTTDRTQRLVGKTVINSNTKNLSYYIANGFVQNIIEIPAEDATREWITIETNLDAESEDVNFSKMIEDRMTELGIQSKIFNLIRYARLYAKGSFLYYAVKAHQSQQDNILAEPIPEEIQSIEFIKNTSDPTKKDYNEIKFTMAGWEIHPSRISWLVNSFIPEMLTGISIVQTIQDAIIAQDNGLWSTATMLNAMALNIFKSDEIADLSPTQKGELLAKIKHLMITLSAIALKNDESMEQLTLNVTGMKEIFDFIFENLAGLSRIPKIILLGKAHGVVGAGQFDTLNHYANISRFQENKLRPILEKIIDLIVKEQNGEIYQELNGNIEDLEVTFDFNSLWILDPISQADTDLKKSQRDQIDITVGKTSPEEARQLDPRYAGLEPFVMDRRNPPDMTPPDVKKPDDDKLEVPEEKETSE
jgi:phage-related protein (TIGR01555 family)